jgi:hypothetical protein
MADYTPEQRTELYAVTDIMSDMQTEGLSLEAMADRLGTTAEALQERITASNIDHIAYSHNARYTIFKKEQPDFIARMLDSMGIEDPRLTGGPVYIPAPTEK